LKSLRGERLRQSGGAHGCNGVRYRITTSATG
jgi:hypothetical protein